jgi:NADH-quinone oxidoreductase subunit N
VNGTDVLALLPLLLIAATAISVMLAIAIRRSHRLTLWLALVGLAAAFACVWAVVPVAPRQVTALLIVDRYALFYIGLIVTATAAVAILAYGYFERREGNPEEFYVLLLVAAFGSTVLVASSHFASFFLGLEILSVSLYVLASYPQTRKLPLEAGVKYLILAASSAAFLLFGMALIYAELGTMEFARMATLVASETQLTPALLLPGMALIVTGIGFKLGVVPFHLWTPDVYQGAPAPVTAFIATVSKGGMFALLLRYFYVGGGDRFGAMFIVFSIIAIASMVIGNLLALLQDNVKRILAYSSIAHMGYLLVAFQAGGTLAAEAVSFYLVAYFITTVGAFGIVTVLSEDDRDADALSDYRGLFWRRPMLAAIFTVMLLSLAGIPVTAGFVGKFYIVAAGVSAAMWALILILVVSSVIGLFYYLRIVAALYEGLEATVSAPAAMLSLPLAGSYVLAALTLLLLWFGVYPAPLLDLIRTAMTSLI